MQTLEQKTEYTRKQSIDWVSQGAFDTGFTLGFFYNKVQQFREQCSETDKLSFFGNEISLVSATREELLIFLKTFGGKWEKEINTFYKDKIDYRQEVVHPFLEYQKITLKATQVEPPPSCQIVEEEVVVPARKEKRKRIVCPEPTLDEVKGVSVKPEGEVV